MVEKTLSTGTLNLRFMQNARRAQQLSSVSLEKAHVKDDAEWEVAPDIRKAWGLAEGESSSDSNDDLYERSYMPFLFPSVSEKLDGEENGTSSVSGVKPQGRRKFNKNGEESSKPPDPQPIEIVQPDHARKIKIKSISSTTSAIAKPSKKLKEPASRLIYDNSSVGVDLRSLSNRTSSAAMSSSNATTLLSAPSSRDATAASVASSARKGKRRQDNVEDQTAGLKKTKLSIVE
ncbi:uncharacterized protein EDB91DRAFT_1151325 [Suillus paluster]|uniref:uncharacterized protein n=1 Tax=Suillus paluster TaxID=48578 RepID=UPI001B86B1BE|nr:uncharacterized protein EDB91DRAFT_1151325 [Suillus paluster]KAG1732657.1 hypothetical protein EDB91DRAFT_1151325 [Suillus paluster]